MRGAWRRLWPAAVAAAVLAALALLAVLSAVTPAPTFVRRSGPNFVLDRVPHTFLGANNYYLSYSPPGMVDHVLTTARDQHFMVLRTWAFIDTGGPPASRVRDAGGTDVYFQYWDGARPAINDGPDGLQRLDYLVHRAGQLGLRLVLVLTNNWKDFGGMDQYVGWRGGAYHDEFYTDPVIRQWFKEYVAQLINRTNRYTGRRYRDDPTILAWELANEPRCHGSGAYPASEGCSTRTLLAWVQEMSAYVKGLDPNHLVGTGDEGLYCSSGAHDWTDNCSAGVDTLAFAALDTIDYLSFHLYAGDRGLTPEWGVGWIRRHVTDARRLGKPVLLGEFGYQDARDRLRAYRAWTSAFAEAGGNGALVWMLAGAREDGQRYPDFDGFTVYCPSPVCAALSTAARTALRR